MPIPFASPSAHPSAGLWHVEQEIVPFPEIRGSK